MGLIYFGFFFTFLLKFGSCKDLNSSKLIVGLKSRPPALVQYFPENYLFNPDDFNVTLGRDLNENEALKFVMTVEPWVNGMSHWSTLKSWAFATDITPENEEASVKASIKAVNFHREKIFPLYSKFDYTKFKNPKLKRLFWMESLPGITALTPEKSERLKLIETEMAKIYSTAKVCSYKNSLKCDLPLDPDITEFMASSRDPNELQHYWLSWHETSTKNMSTLFREYVDISNEMAKLNGFPSMGHYWRRPYEDPLMPQEFWALWGQIRPLYEQLHAYVRRRLLTVYGTRWVSPRGTIPAHLLGNMWAQSWQNIRDLLNPFNTSEDVVNMDVTPNMIKANMTIDTMFLKAEDFFESLGFPKLPQSFWTKSVVRRPPQPRNLVCHAEAWDFSTGDDFRIKMCTTVTWRDFVTVHHEMGHTHYQSHYRHQLNTYRDGANPGFHEAIGDVIAMSVASPNHMQKVLGLLPEYKDTTKNQINFLMSQALQLVVDLPHALSLEQWRWDVFSKEINPNQYNCHWWTLRSRVLGVKPPVRRSWKDFDPGAKFHIPNSTPYDRYFHARILTYQLHEAFCRIAGEYGNGKKKPLHMCSIYGNKVAGTKLRELLTLGSTVQWQILLGKLTGKNRLDAGSILKYYEPLMAWLMEENRKNGDLPGWEQDELENICTPDKPAP